MNGWLSRIRRIGLLFTISTVSAVAVLPANWLLRLLPSPALVQVVSANGTLWSGQALVSVGQDGYARSIAPIVSWETRWDPLPSVTVRHPWLSQPISLHATWQGITLSAGTLHMPANVLSTMDARIAALHPGGQVSLQWPVSHWRWLNNATPDWQLTLLWTHARTALSHVAPIGSYRLTFKPENNHRIQVHLNTQSGPIMASGTGFFDAAQGLSFTGQASLDPLTQGTDKASLSELLALLGSQQQGHTVLRVP